MSFLEILDLLAMGSVLIAIAVMSTGYRLPLSKRLQDASMLASSSMHASNHAVTSSALATRSIKGRGSGNMTDPHSSLTFIILAANAMSPCHASNSIGSDNPASFSAARSFQFMHTSLRYLSSSMGIIA